MTPESLVVNALLAIRVESSMEGGRAAYTKSEIMARKPVVWLGDSLGKVRGFALEARRWVGQEKKSRKTPRLDVELAKQRYRTLIRDRKQ